MAVSMRVDVTKNNPSLGLRGARRAELLGLGGTRESGDCWEQREVPLEGHFSAGGGERAGRAQHFEGGAPACGEHRIESTLDKYMQDRPLAETSGASDTEHRKPGVTLVIQLNIQIVPPANILTTR